ncbi:MAG TPA: hypothetical protein VMW66_03850 [Elusimicrobiales bacterium]|nr:hypothetical protein [Elusimicrobiales bacterium]
MKQGNLFNYNDYTKTYTPTQKKIAKETRLEALAAVNKDVIKAKIRHFADQAIKPFHSFEVSMILRHTLLTIRPRLTEMWHDGELKIVGKVKTPYSRTPVCLYEKISK